MAIDVAFDFRSDCVGPDPDSGSPTLRHYHRLLWSKRLPSGASFDLSDTTPGEYLHHRSELGEFCLSSDSAIPTFTNRERLKPIIEQVAESDNEAFLKAAYTIGAMIVFPAHRIDRLGTINQDRGMHPAISDRFDLTLECIRRHYYSVLPNPLAGTLSRYAAFFALFGDFPGYVNFFLLDDLVTYDFRVRFFMRFDGDFRAPPVPNDVDTYREYRQRSIEFIEARNRRINQLGI